MLGKQSGQMGFGDMEAMGRVPEGHFLKKIDGQINWRPFEKLLEPLYHPTQGRPSHPPWSCLRRCFCSSGTVCPIPGWKKPSVTACRFSGFSVCLCKTRFRMRPESVVSQYVGPGRLGRTSVWPFGGATRCQGVAGPTGLAGRRYFGQGPTAGCVRSLKDIEFPWPKGYSSITKG